MIISWLFYHYSFIINQLNLKPKIVFSCFRCGSNHLCKWPLLSLLHNLLKYLVSCHTPAAWWSRIPMSCRRVIYQSTIKKIVLKKKEKNLDRMAIFINRHGNNVCEMATIEFVSWNHFCKYVCKIAWLQDQSTRYHRHYGRGCSINIVFFPLNVLIFLMFRFVCDRPAIWRS